MSWELTEHLSQEFLAIDDDSGMVVGKMVLWRMDQRSAMGGWDQEKLRALQFLPVKKSEATISLPRNRDDFSDVDMNVVEDEDNMECEGNEKGFPSVEREATPWNPENVELSLSNMYADPKAVKNMLKHKQFLQKKNTSLEEFKGLENQPLNQPQQMFPVQMHKSFEDEMRRKLEASAERNPKGKDMSWAQSIQPGAGQEMIISISPETLSPQINSPEQIEETNEQVRGLEDENLTSDDDIQIEDLGEVSDSETEQQRGLNLKTVKVMLNRIIINPNFHQGHTGDQVFEEAEMSPPGSDCVSCSFCQADIRKEDLDAHQVSNQCRQLRTPASYFPSLPQINPSLPQENTSLLEVNPYLPQENPPSASSPPVAPPKNVEWSSLAGKPKRGRPRKERWISSST